MELARLTIGFSFITYCFGVVHGNPVDNEFKVELVQVLFRHGARMPIGCEADLLSNHSGTNYKPWGYAQLTNEGMMQEYQIGKMLRERYNGFIPEVYEPEHVYAFGSGVGRTKASVELALAGLYPPKGELIWNPELLWMPIPIHSMPRQLDILNKPRFCPKFIELLKNLYYNSTEFQEAGVEHHEIREFLEKIYGRPFGFGDTFCAYNAMMVGKNLNAQMPEWYDNETFERLENSSKFYLESLSYTPELKKLNGGTYVRRFIENINNNNPKLKDRKIYMYSTHDKSLHAVARFHDIILPRIPDYGSAIILEKLRDAQDKLYIKLLLWSGTPKEITTLKMENCSEVCPMDEYMKIVDPILPSDDDMMCLFKNLQPEDLEKIFNTDTGEIES